MSKVWNYSFGNSKGFSEKVSLLIKKELSQNKSE